MNMHQALWSSDDDDNDSDDDGDAQFDTASIIDGKHMSSRRHGLPFSPQDVRLAASTPSKANFQMDIGDLVGWSPSPAPMRNSPGRRGSPLSEVVEMQDRDTGL